jgi:hypothetical protein
MDREDYPFHSQVVEDMEAAGAPQAARKPPHQLRPGPAIHGQLSQVSTEASSAPQKGQVFVEIIENTRFPGLGFPTG